MILFFCNPPRCKRDAALLRVWLVARNVGQVIEWFEAESMARSGSGNGAEIAWEAMRNPIPRCLMIVKERPETLKERRAEINDEFGNPARSACRRR
jgi:hypothetical protein